MPGADSAGPASNLREVSSGEASFPVLEASDIDEISGLLQAGEYFWLDLHDPKPDELGKLRELLHLHPLHDHLLDWRKIFHDSRIVG